MLSTGRLYLFVILALAAGAVFPPAAYAAVAVLVVDAFVHGQRLVGRRGR